jgi:hypothetical protein
VRSERKRENGNFAKLNAKLAAGKNIQSAGVQQPNHKQTTQNKTKLKQLSKVSLIMSSNDNSLTKIHEVFGFKTENYWQLLAPALEKLHNTAFNSVTLLKGSDFKALQDKIIGKDAFLKKHRYIFEALVVHLKFQHYPDHLKVTFEDFMAAHLNYIDLDLEANECTALYEFYNYVKCGLELYGKESKIKSNLMLAIGYLTSGVLNGRVYRTGGGATQEVNRRVAIYEELGGNTVAHLTKERQSRKRSHSIDSIDIDNDITDTDSLSSGSSSLSGSYTSRRKTLVVATQAACTCTCLHCGNRMPSVASRYPLTLNVYKEKPSVFAGPVSPAAGVPLTAELPALSGVFDDDEDFFAALDDLCCFL